MLRRGYDIVFIRMICISLIAIALIFALILTNVFVDVDRFFISKTHKKEDAKRYMTFDNEAKDDMYNEKRSNDKITVLKRSKRSSTNVSQDSFRSIYNDKNTMEYKMEIYPGNGTLDTLQLNDLGAIMQFLHNKTDSQTYNQLGVISTLLETLFKLRPKRQLNYADGTIDKTNSNVNKNATMEENKHIDIEIKTHFDSKTTDSGRKLFISHLIDKIRRALRSDTEVISNQIENEPYFKTREQEPIVIAKKIIFDSGNFPRLNNNDRRRIDKYTIKTNKEPKFKNIQIAERGNKYVEDFQNSLERRFQKPIADNVANSNVNSELYPDYNSLSLLLNNIDGAGVSMDYDRNTDDPSGQKSYYNGLDNFIKVYHNTIL